MADWLIGRVVKWLFGLFGLFRLFGLSVKEEHWF
jgi:hypothetical protein